MLAAWCGEETDPVNKKKRVVALKHRKSRARARRRAREARAAAAGKR